MTAALADLAGKGGGLTPESLAENDQFLDALAHASSVAAERVSVRSSTRSQRRPERRGLQATSDADTQAIVLRHVSPDVPAPPAAAVLAQRPAEVV